MDKAGVPYWATLPAAGAVCLVGGLPVRPAGAAARGPVSRARHLRARRGDAAALKYHAPRELDRRRAGHRHRQARGALRVCRCDAGPVAVLLHLAVDARHVRPRLEPAARPRRPGAGGDPRPAIAAEAMGIHNALYKSLAFGVSAMYTGVAGALGAIAVQFVAPDSFNIFLSIILLVGIVVGGLASISGRALRRALHPVRAQHRRRDLEGRALGGLRRLHDRLRLPDADRRRRRAAPAYSAKEESHHEGAQHDSSPHAGRAGAARRLQLAQKKYDPGATDNEIKIGNTNPYSGPASAYGTIGKAIAAYFKMVNDQGGINGRKINFIILRRRLQPAEDRRDGAQAGRAGRGAVRVPDARHAVQHRDPQVHEREEGAAAVRRDRRHQVERPEELSLDHGLAAELPDRGEDLREAHPEDQARTRRSRSSTRTTTTARTT